MTDLTSAEWDDECPYCGGEGVVFDCFDGCCEDADVGCDDCLTSCPHCTKRPASPELRQVLADALGEAAPAPAEEG